MHRSLWLQEALADEEPAPPLRGDARADVAIVGGGYVGLWTALRIKQREPGCDVVVVERDVCGAGASGRNGGQLHAWWERLDVLVRLFGEDEGLRLARASQEAIAEVAALEREHGERLDVRLDGWLWTATTEAQRGAWAAAVAACEARGLGVLRAVGRDELVARTGSDVHLAGIEEVGAGTLHPGRYVRALRRLALRAGVRIHEGTPVRRLERSRPPVLRLQGGASLTADRVVIAMNAWAARLPELRSQLFVVGSDLVATEPIPDRLRELGWTGGEAICDSQDRVLYYHATPSGRVVIGRGGGRIAPLGRVDGHFDGASRWSADCEAGLRRVYPMLADVRISHRWSGPVDASFTSLPLLGRLGGRDDVLYGVGWSGTGVGPSVLGGRILASLALGVRDEWSTCGLVDQPVHGRYPPEPLRTAGAVLVRRFVMRQGAAEEAGRPVGRLTRRMVGLVPGLRR